MRQNQLVNAERDLLEKTLLGTIEMLSQILALVNPTAQQRANRLKFFCRQIAKSLGRTDIWFFEMVALLSQVGCLNIPTDLLDANRSGQTLTVEECELLDEHPAMAEELLQKIPRMEEIARAVALQNQPCSTFLSGEAAQVDEKTAMATQILHVVLELDRQTHHLGRPFSATVKQLESSPEEYSTVAVAELRNLPPQKDNLIRAKVSVRNLTMSMILCEDIYTKTGLKLASDGQQLSDFLLIGIRNYASKIGVNEPFTVLAPVEFVHYLTERGARS